MEVVNHSSVRIIFATWWLCSLIISVAYAANLVAVMSVTLRSLPVKSFKDLATQTHTKVAISKGVALGDLLKASSDPTYNAMYRNIDLYLRFGVDDYTRHNGENVIMAEEITLLKDYRSKQTDPCEFEIGHDSFYKSQFAFAVRKGLPLKDAMSKKTLQIVQAGLLKKWVMQYFPHDPYCPKSSSQARSATVTDTFGAIIVLFGGILSSFIALVMEHFVNNINKPVQHPNR